MRQSKECSLGVSARHFCNTMVPYLQCLKKDFLHSIMLFLCVCVPVCPEWFSPMMTVCFLKHGLRLFLNQMCTSPCFPGLVAQLGLHWHIIMMPDTPWQTLVHSAPYGPSLHLGKHVPQGIKTKSYWYSVILIYQSIGIQQILYGVQYLLEPSVWFFFFFKAILLFT